MSLVDEIESYIEYTQELCRYCKGYDLGNGLITLTAKKFSDSSPILASHLAQEVSDIIDRYHSPILINYDDLKVLHEDEQCLKRMYMSQQYSNKIKMLSEYYKFHNEVPRLFMLSISETLDNYIDEKRQLEYVKVTNILKKESNNSHPQKRQTGYEPMNKLLDSIDLSYEDFEKRDKKKGHKGQNRNKKSLKGKKDRLHIQSIEQRIVPLSCQTNKNSKQSSKKKPHTRSLVGSNNENSNNIRSCNALSRQKSRSNQQNIYKHSVGSNKHLIKQPLTHRQDPVCDRKLSKQPIKPSSSKSKFSTINNQLKQKDEQHTDLARMRCNSRPMLKTSTVPLKIIDMNKLGNRTKLQQQSSKTNLQSLSKIDKKPEYSQQKNRQKISINNRQQSSKNIFASVNSTAQVHMHNSQQSNVNNQNDPSHQISKFSKTNKIDNMFNNVLAMKKYRTNQP